LAFAPKSGTSNLPVARPPKQGENPLFLPCHRGRNIKSEHFSEHTFLSFFQNMLQSEQKYLAKSKFLVNNRVGSRPQGFFLQMCHIAGILKYAKNDKLTIFFFFSKTAQSNYKKCDFFKNSVDHYL
jgi:hypothetical protein